MSNPLVGVNPFDELGRILSAGGEGPVIEEALTGIGLEGLIGFVLGRYTSLNQDQATRLASHAVEAVQAGQAATTSQPGGPINAELAPINPLLFGDEPAGRRVQVVLDVHTTDSESGEGINIAVKADFGTLPTANEMLEEILARLEEIEKNYPERWGQLESAHEGNVDAIIHYMQRRY